MPLKQELALKRVAAQMAKKGELKKKKGETTQEAKNAFVYGIMRKRGWKPGQGAK